MAHVSNATVDPSDKMGVGSSHGFVLDHISFVTSATHQHAWYLKATEGLVLGAVLQYSGRSCFPIIERAVS